VAGDRVRYYSTEWIGRDTVFPIGSVDNQSWRGGFARVLGYDAGTGPQLVAAIAVTGALAVLAWWVLGPVPQRRDRLGSLLVVMLFGLLASPVSWTNHWVWIVPLLIWLLHGPWWDNPGARVLWWTWLVVAVTAVPNALAQLQSSRWQISRPWYQAWAGLIYPILALATRGWIIATGIRARRGALSSQSPILARPAE
jgi:alpha-1,2-mannosyltransferase